MTDNISSDFEPHAFQRVLEGINQHTTEQETRYFYKQPTSSDIAALIAKVNSTGKRSSRKKYAYGNRISNFLYAMAEFAVVANNNTIAPSEEIIWGATSLVVTMALSSTSYLGTIIDTLESLGRDREEISQIIRKVYISKATQSVFCAYHLVALDICKDLLSLLKERDPKNLKPGWKFFKMRSEYDQTRFERLKINLEAEAQLSQERCNADEREAISLHRQENLQYYVTELSKTWPTVLEKGKEDPKLQPLIREILSMRISAYDYEADYHRHITEVSSRTADWLTGMPEFTGWSHYHGRTASLWLHGSTGSGKSMLAAHVVKMLITAHPENVIYFFCNPEKPSSLQLETILRALLQQLIKTTRQVHHTYPFFDQPLSVKDIEDRMEQIIKFRLLWSTRQCDYMIIDGTELMDRKEEAELTKVLEKLCWGGHRRLLVVKQGEPPRHRPRINIDKLEQMDVDVKLYIENEIDLNVIQGRFRFDKKLVSTVKLAIIASANGNFLMAKLHIALVLHTLSEESLLDILERLPQTLVSTYNLILNSIKSGGEKTKAKKIFSLIGVSAEPITVEALSDYLNWNTTNNDELPAYSSTALLDVCKGLVVCKEYQGKTFVHFVHPTFREYLVENGILHEPRAHIEIAKNCMLYLHQDEFEHKVQRDKGKSAIAVPVPASSQIDSDDEDSIDDIAFELSDLKLLAEDDIEGFRQRVSIAHSQTILMEQLARTHPFLAYARLHWLYHSRTLDKKDPSWTLFGNLVMRKTQLLFDIHPWTKTSLGTPIQIYSAKQFRTLANDWANQRKHFALSWLIVDWATKTTNRRVPL